MQKSWLQGYTCVQIIDTGMAQWLELSPPTTVARVRFPGPTLYVG